MQNWMLLGVYFTQIQLYKMKKVKSSLCLGSNENSEDLTHFILHCGFFNTIREKYLPQFISQNNKLGEILKNEEMIILTILDPVSSNLPEVVHKNGSLSRLCTVFPESFATTCIEKEKNYTKTWKKYPELY